MSCEESVSQWIVGAKQGDSQAIEKLWQRYFEQLVRLARTKLSGTPRRAADEEDVALSAFASFCKAAEGGRFPQLTDRNDLWQLLICITAQKAVDQMRYEHRAKRGGGRVRGESAFISDASASNPGLAQVVGETPTPDFAAMVAEECQKLLEQLDDDLRPVALAKMENYTNEEIAGRLNCSLSTIERSLRLIRKIWQTGKEQRIA
ncbi:MAG: ECF-type sigma factor [Thermoguttaceae bacterium]|jgi:DNA-directed RNA polymerase specialized sigma24 family protein